MGESTILQSSYDYLLVALSVLIAIAASYAALTLAARVSMARNQARTAWLFGGAIAMGTGIWSMHYTGMMAYRLPIQVYCHVPTVLLSLLAAVGASFVALFAVSRPRMNALHVVAGSLLMAAGISALTANAPTGGARPQAARFPTLKTLLEESIRAFSDHREPKIRAKASASRKIEQAAQGRRLRDDGHRNPYHALHCDGSRKLPIHAWNSRCFFLHGNLFTWLRCHCHYCRSCIHVHVFASLVANLG